MLLTHPKSRFSPLVLLLLLASFAGTVCCANGVTNAPLAIDPAFMAGFAKLKQTTGFIEQPTSHTQAVWQSNLQLWVGVKATEGAKQTIHFVQLTTLPPPLITTNGKTWQPLLRTNHWSWSSSNWIQFVTTSYPVRLRVFEETGRQLKEGQTPMAWGMLTNGLLDLCRISLKTYGGQTNSPARPGEGKPPGNNTNPPKPSDELMRATGGGFLWMFGMFGDFQTVPAVADVWDQAQCAIRWPSTWTIATSIFKGFDITLMPGFDKVTLAHTTNANDAGSLYLLPVDLKSEKRLLTHTTIIVGPARGAEMLLAGIRSIHAAHPTKPKNEFLAQVLAAGMVPDEK